MLETGIPKSIWRGEKMREKLVGQFDKERGKFMDKPDTKFQPSLDQKIPETKRFAFADKVSDFGLNDMISDKKFRFENVNNHMLLGEQLPEDRPFKFSTGIKGVNDHFDSMAPNIDYRYTDPQFYEYKLKNMTQQKIAETNWRVQGDSITNPDDLDGYARAVAYAEEYRKSKLPKSDTPSVQSSPESVQERSSDTTTNIINAAAGGGTKNLSLRSGKTYEKNESPSIEIEPPKRSGKEIWNQFINKYKESKDFQDIKKNVKTRGESNRGLVQKIVQIGKSSLKKREANENESMGKEDKIVKFKKEAKNAQKETVSAPNSPRPKSAPLSPSGNDFTQLKTNLDNFYKIFASHFNYEQDKTNPSEFIISNGKDKVGVEMAKYMRDELKVAGITAASNLEKANAELLNLEASIKRIKQNPPKMGRQKGGGTKASSKDDLELHFENRTPANSKNADATREARAVSQGSNKSKPKVNVSELAPNGTRIYKDKTTVVMPKNSVFNGKIVYE